MQPILKNNDFENQILRKAQDKFVVSCLDGLILCQLRNEQLSGYDLVNVFFKKFQILISPGTVYSNLYSLERNGLIECVLNGKKREYRLTQRGKQAIGVISKSEKMREFQDLVKKEFFPDA